MAKSKEQKPVQEVQPRAITPDSSLVRYRAGVQLELQKFGESVQSRQLHLTEQEGGQPEDSVVEVRRLSDLTVSQARALSAIQILLDRTGYRGNEPGQQQASAEWKWPGPLTLPRLSVSFSDYFEAYGLQRMGDGSYYGHQAEEALEALQSFTRPMRYAYRRKRWEGQGRRRKELSDIIVVDRPLFIMMARTYEGLDEEDADKVLSGQAVAQRATRLVIDIGPLLVEGIDNFYLLKPATLYEEIREIAASRTGKKARESRVYSQFVELLLTLNLPEWKVGKETLIQKLTSLDGYARQRKQSRIDELLLEAFGIAQEAGYLLGWREDLFGMLTFTLNPERMGREPKYKPKAGAQDEKDSS